MALELLLRGLRHDVYLLLDHRGRSSVRDEVAASHPTEQKQFAARVKRLADVGQELASHYVSLADSRSGIWYLRASKHLRVWFCVVDERIVLLNALRKTKRETEPIGLQRARELKVLHHLMEGES
jgi:phage-related protein